MSLSDPHKAAPMPFDETYFHTGPYASVSFKKYSQYWWSNRYYALLARRHGPSKGRLLEIGCGLGHLLGWLTDRYQVYGTDINLSALETARQVVPQGVFTPMSAEDLSPLESGSFQIVIAKHVVEHLAHPERAIAEIRRVLAAPRPPNRGGVLILATPNLDSPMRLWQKENWVGYKDPTHISLKRPGEWLEALKAAGLRPKRVFSDGFWDAPYLPWIPARLQNLFIGAPGGLQAILGWSIIPLRFGESLIVLAEKA